MGRMRRYLKGSTPESLLALVQAIPKVLRSKLLELTEPKSSGKILGNMDMASRARYINEFSENYRERVLSTYDEDEANRVRSELFISSNIDTLCELIRHMMIVGNKRRPTVDEELGSDKGGSISGQGEKGGRDDNDEGTEDDDEDGAEDEEDGDEEVY
jgi:Ran GTPase-activating protein (RanGAP) involved in mRNA processing and transport